MMWRAWNLVSFNNSLADNGGKSISYVSTAVLQRQETDSVASAVLKLIDQKIKMELASHLLVLQRTQNELLEPICP